MTRISTAFLFVGLATGLAHGQLVVVTPDQTDEILANPGMGWETFHRTSAQDQNLRPVRFSPSLTPSACPMTCRWERTRFRWPSSAWRTPGPSSNWGSGGRSEEGWYSLSTVRIAQ